MCVVWWEGPLRDLGRRASQTFSGRLVVAEGVTSLPGLIGMRRQAEEDLAFGRPCPNALTFLSGLCLRHFVPFPSQEIQEENDGEAVGGGKGRRGREGLWWVGRGSFSGHARLALPSPLLSEGGVRRPKCVLGETA